MAQTTITQNNAQQTQTSTPAPQVLNGVDQYTPPTGLTQTKTAGGGTGYSDAQGNVYVQSAPGQYKLMPPANTAPSPIAPTTAPQPNPAPTATPPAPQATPTAPTTQVTTATQPTTTSQQGQFYYTKSTDANGNSVVTYYDANGNVLPTNPIGGDQFQNNPEQTPNAGGQLVQLPSAPTAGGNPTQQPTADQLNTELAANTANYTVALDALNSQSDAAYSDYAAKLNEIQNGTFPLTPTQQALLTATQQQIDQVRAQQVIANQTYVQGTQVFEARSGEGSGGQTTAMGNVQAAINTGLAKLQALDTAAATTMANLQQGFQDNNLKMITDSYTAWGTYMSQKENALKAISDATSTAMKDLRDFTYKQMQDNITNTLAYDSKNLQIAQFSWTQKMDLVKNQLAQAQLDEKTKTDMQSYTIKQESLNLQRQANDLLQGAFKGSTPASSTLPNGSPDPAAQATFLAKLPPTAQELVKGLDNYTLNPSSLPTRLTMGGTGLTQQQALALVKAYDPLYDESQYAARAKYNLNFNSGSINTQRIALNTAINHIGDMKTAADALAPLFTHGGLFGIGTQAYNTIQEVIANNSADPRVIAYNNIANKVSTEIASAYGQGTGGERSSQEVLSQINSSAAQKDSLMNSTVTLLSGLTTSMYQDYQNNMGKAPDPSAIIFPNTQQVWSTLQSKGIGTGVNLLPSPYQGVSNSDLLNSITGGSSTPATVDPTTFFNMFNNTQTAAANAQQ